MNPFRKKEPAAKTSAKKPVSFSCTMPNANKVAIAGSFNAWKTHPMRFQKEKNIWACTLELPPGRYEYRFVVNGTDWINDPTAKETCPNDQGGMNCVKHV